MILRVRHILLLIFLCLIIFNSAYSQVLLDEVISVSKNELVPADKIVSNEELKNHEKNPLGFSYVFPNETRPARLKPVLQEMKGGVYISVGTERGFISASISKISNLLLLDIDPDVVLYNRLKMGLIAISRSKEDLRYLILNAPHQEWIDRIKSYGGKLTYGVKEAVFDRSIFDFNKRYTRAWDEFGNYMYMFLHSYYPNGDYYGANYNFNEKQYARIKSMVIAGKVSAHLADLTDKVMMQSISNRIKEQGLKLSAIDISNAWDVGTLFVNKGTVDADQRSVSSYDSKAFEQMIDVFRYVSEGETVVIFSEFLDKPSRYGDFPYFYVAFSFDYLTKNYRKIHTIPNLIYSYCDVVENRPPKANSNLKIDKTLEINPVLPEPVININGHDLFFQTKNAYKNAGDNIIEILEQGVCLSNFDNLLNALFEYVPTVSSEKEFLILDEVMQAVKKADIYTELKEQDKVKLKELTVNVQEKAQVFLFFKSVVDNDLVDFLKIYTESKDLSSSRLIDLALDEILNKTAENVTKDDLLALNSVITLINSPVYYPTGKYKYQFEFLSYLNNIYKLKVDMKTPQFEINLIKCRELKANIERSNSLVK